MSLIDRLQHAWNAFTNRDSPISFNYQNLGYSSSYRPDRIMLSGGNERSIINSRYNRIATDCTSVLIREIVKDENNRYKSDAKTALNNCLTLEANKDQTAKAFIKDVVMSLFDEGCIAVVPVETDVDPNIEDAFKINSMRVGKIIQWYPDYVKINVYNDTKGKFEDIIMPKKSVAIIENPFYSVMNERNSILQRLIRKLNLLDAIDEQSSSGKLDLIIQLPYVIKTDARKEQAEKRRKDIEDQLLGSKYGIAYTDGTEKITQLNRPVENNLMKQIEFLISMLDSQLGLTDDVLNGSADEKTMINYYNRTVLPVMDAIADEYNRKFLTKTARTQGHEIKYFYDPFRLVPVQVIADIADKFTRNEIMSSNEVRQLVGMKPVSDPKADELKNKNLKGGENEEFASVKNQNGDINIGG